MGYWYCNNCKTTVEPLEVTFEELHESCGHEVEWINKGTRVLKDWIPLKTKRDTLPEIEDKNVLVHFENGSIELVHIEDWFNDITAGLKDDGSVQYIKWYMSQPVTHWMELPSPPK